MVALIVTTETPVKVGVPVMAPVAASIDSPAGKFVAPKVVGAPVASIEYENAAPWVPAAVKALVMTGPLGTYSKAPISHAAP